MFCSIYLQLISSFHSELLKFGSYEFRIHYNSWIESKLTFDISTGWVESLAKHWPTPNQQQQSFWYLICKSPCSLSHSESCRVMESFFHFPAKYCTSSSMFIKTSSFLPVIQDSPASCCQGSMDLWGLAWTSLCMSVWTYKYLNGYK